MAICGVAVGQTEAPLRDSELDSMLAALAIGPEDVRAGSAAEQAGLGAISSLRTTSLARSSPVVAACDGEIYNQHSLPQEVAAVPPPLALAVLTATLHLKHGASFLSPGPA